MKTLSCLLAFTQVALSSCAQGPASPLPAPDPSSDDNETIQRLVTSGSIDIIIPAGKTYRITRPITITNKHISALGCRFVISSDGGDSCGSISIVGSTLNGGEYYTDASPNFGNTIDGSSVLKLTNSSAVSCLVYSQLSYCMRASGKITIDSCKLFGGGYSSLEIQGDFSGLLVTHNMINNSGARYIGEKIYSTPKKSGIGIHLSPSTNVDNVQIINNVLDYNGHSGIWANGGSHAISDLTITNNRISNTGTCLTEGGSAVRCTESGTCIEVINCPKSEITLNYTFRPLGYNIAVAKGSNNTRVYKNTCIGASGDPGVYTGFADDVVIDENDVGFSTYGLSIGESGPSRNCIVRNNNVHDNTYAPLLFNNGSNLTIEGNTIRQYVFSSAYEGKGAVKHRDACRIGAGADSVFSAGNTFTGNFNALYTPNGGLPKTISSKGDKISFPISPH